MLLALSLVLAPTGSQAQISTSYTYDALGRVATVTHQGPSLPTRVITYTYDPAGNRTQVVKGGVNTPPVAVDDTLNAVSGAATPFDPRANDTDVDGNPLTIIAVSTPAHGGVVIAPDGMSVTYTSVAHYTGPESFTYTISDGNSGTATATVNVVVTSTANHPPVATNDAITPTAGVTLTFDPRINDSDPDGDTLTVTAVSAPSHGTAAIASGGVAISYTATAHYAGSDSFTYTISDGNGGTLTATVSATVTAPVNAAPVAVNDAIMAVAAVAKTFDPRANDSDADGDALTITTVSTPAHGVAVVGSGGTSITYTPTSGYSGSDSFTYTISDGQGGTATATVSVTVTASVSVDYLIVAGGGGGGGYVGGGGGGGEARTGALTLSGATSFTVVVGAAGTGGVNDFSAEGANGGDSSLGAILSKGGGGGGGYSNRNGLAGGNGGGGGSWASVGGGPTGTSGNYGGSATGGINAGAGGGGGSGGQGTAGAATSGSGGAGISSNINGTSTTYGGGGYGGNYVGGFGAHGAGSGANRGGGGNGGGTMGVVTAGTNGDAGVVIVRYPTGSMTATGGTITTSGGYTIHTFTSSGTFAASAPNHPPVATNDAISTPLNTAKTFDPRANDSDADGDSLTITAVSTPAHGVAVVGSGGTSVTYTLTTGYSGADSFTYTISDGQGGTATATVSVTVAANAAPVAVNDAITAVAAVAKTFDPRANDSDPDGDPLTIQSVTTPTNGTVAINGGGTSLTYTPTVGTSGPDSFSYTIADGHGGTATATVNLTVTASTAPAFGWSTAGTISTGVTTVTTSKGANSIAAGDLLLVFETTTDNSGPNHNITCPTGFTALSWSNYYYVADGMNQAGCWKIAGTGETGAYTLNWTTGMTQSSQWTLVAITGANPAPIDATAIQGNGATSSPSPTVTSSGANRLLLSCVGAAGSSIAISSPPAGTTQLFTSNTGALVKFACAAKTAPSGATGAQTWTLNQANTSAAFSLLVKP